MRIFSNLVFDGGDEKVTIQIGKKGDIVVEVSDSVSTHRVEVHSPNKVKFKDKSNNSRADRGRGSDNNRDEPA